MPSNNMKLNINSANSTIRVTAACLAGAISPIAKIFDISGKIAGTLTEAHKLSTESFSWSIPKLSNGAYYLVLNAGINTYSQEFIMCK